MIKVSVIVPVYNGEKNLRQCLDSICDQTLSEIEIICVDDGSTDGSLQILQEYAQRDERFTILQQENQYAGAARNAGMKCATGEYLMFWDCDDFFELDALEIMYNRALETEADVCVCGGNQYLEETGRSFPSTSYMREHRIPGDVVFNRKINEKYILNFTNEAAWNKMVRREFVEEQGLLFQPVRNGNDVYFTINVLCLANRVTTIAKPLVNYRKNQKQSLVGTLSKSPLTPFQAWIDAAANLEAMGALPEQSFVNKALGSVVYLLRNIYQRDVFLDTVTFLKQGGLEGLHIMERPADYYYSQWYAELVDHLLHDTPEEFHEYLTYVTYIQLTERIAEKGLQKKKIRDIKQKLEKTKDALKKERLKSSKEINRLQKALDIKDKQYQDLRDSLTYRIGNIILWLPKKIKRIFYR